MQRIYNFGFVSNFLYMCGSIYSIWLYSVSASFSLVFSSNLLAFQKEPLDCFVRQSNPIFFLESSSGKFFATKCGSHTCIFRRYCTSLVPPCQSRIIQIWNASLRTTKVFEICGRIMPPMSLYFLSGLWL